MWETDEEKKKPEFLLLFLFLFFADRSIMSGLFVPPFLETRSGSVYFGIPQKIATVSFVKRKEVVPFPLGHRR